MGATQFATLSVDDTPHCMDTMYFAVAGLLVSAYDNLGRAYQTTVYGVNVSGGPTNRIDEQQQPFVALGGTGCAVAPQFLTVHGSED